MKHHGITTGLSAIAAAGPMILAASRAQTWGESVSPEIIPTPDQASMGFSAQTDEVGADIGTILALTGGAISWLSIATGFVGSLKVTLTFQEYPNYN